jgi:hypothetical protein
VSATLTARSAYRYPQIVASELTNDEIEASLAIAERIIGKTKSTG